MEQAHHPERAVRPGPRSRRSRRGVSHEARIPSRQSEGTLARRAGSCDPSRCPECYKTRRIPQENSTAERKISGDKVLIWLWILLWTDRESPLLRHGCPGTMHRFLDKRKDPRFLQQRNGTPKKDAGHCPATCRQTCAAQLQQSVLRPRGRSDRAMDRDLRACDQSRGRAF